MNTNLSILIADDDENYAKSLASYLKSCNNISDVNYALDGEEAIELTRILHPDAVILDILMPLLDGIGFLRRLSEMHMDKKPFVIINSISNSSEILKTASGYGANYFMLKPQPSKCIYDTIMDFLFDNASANHTSTENDDDYSLEEQVSIFLRHLGIPAHLSGYRYIRSAIVYAINDMDSINPITQKLYPALARKYNTNPSCIERAIRHAIGVSWTRGNKKLLTEVFGYSSDTAGTRHPTNAEYIAMAADDFRIRIKYKVNS